MRMKLLKFRSQLVPLVLSGQKDITWRLFDDKDLSVGDKVELREFGKDSSFAVAVITKVTEKKFGDLNKLDKDGHELFSSIKEMYDTYSTYYNTDVTPDTYLKVIHFELA